MQLDQLGVLPSRQLKFALRFLTVRSGRPEPDRDAAAPELLRLLGIEKSQSKSKAALAATGSWTIRADVGGANGSRFIREALVSFGAESDRSFAIREWRHGDIDPAASLPLRDYSRGVHRCFVSRAVTAS